MNFQHPCHNIAHLIFYDTDYHFPKNYLTFIICFRQVVNESLNPVWNQTFDFVVEDGLHDMLMLEVWDHDTFGKVRVSAP